MECITVRIKGGLGNQLFQFAYGYAKSVTHNARLELDLSYFEGDSRHGGYMLDQFQLPDEIKFTKSSLLTRLLLKLNEKTANKLNKLLNLGFDIDAYPANKSNRDRIIIDGYWQDETFFLPVHQDIRNLYNQSLYQATDALEIAQEITNCNSVSIHIRRGDYATNPDVLKIHGLLTLDYYLASIDLIKQSNSDPFFYIFSDDPEWARQNFNFLTRYKIVEEKISSPIIDLALMSQCKHNIIANSTFSWWAAWLNKSPDKKIIAPQQWFADPVMNTRQNIVPKSWIKL